MPLPRRKVLIPAVAVVGVIALGVPAAVLVSMHLADERTRDVKRGLSAERASYL